MIQEYLKISLCALFLLAAIPLHAQQKQKQLEQQAKSTVKKPKPTAPAQAAPPKTYYAYLLVSTDLDVHINVNGERSYTVKQLDDATKIGLDAGDNILSITPLDGGLDGYKTTMNADKPGNKVFPIDLQAKREAAKMQKVEAAKMQKVESDRRAEENRRKEEALKVESDRRAEENRRIEEALKVEADRIAALPAILTDPLAGAFLLVKGGSFTMGCLPDRDGECGSDETTHQVSLSDYYIGETEVTQAQWRAVTGTNPSGFSGCDQCPVETVSWEDIQGFLTRLNSSSAGVRYRLPTEAEWEYAARGGVQSQKYQYSGSNVLTAVAWYNSNSKSKTHPVKAKVANELGLYDMSGNVWELCQDWYGTYPDSRQTNPTGPATGSGRVLRGGSWRNGPTYCRVAYRIYSTPGHRYFNIGFRLARTP